MHISKLTLYTALFWGGGWGMAEAGLGFLLHQLPVPVAGFIMFPVGLYCMSKALAETDKTGSVLLAGLTAASVKALDFLMPGIPAIKVIHPIISILLEAAAVAGILHLRSGRWTWQNLLLMCLTWRAGYVGVLILEAVLSLTHDLAKLGIAGAIQFVVSAGTINFLVIQGCWLSAARRIQLFDTAKTGRQAVAMIVGAIVIQLVLR